MEIQKTSSISNFNKLVFIITEGKKGDKGKIGYLDKSTYDFDDYFYDISHKTKNEQTRFLFSDEAASFICKYLKHNSLWANAYYRVKDCVCCLSENISKSQIYIYGQSGSIENGFLQFKYGDLSYVSLKDATSFLNLTQAQDVLKFYLNNHSMDYGEVCNYDDEENIKNSHVVWVITDNESGFYSCKDQIVDNENYYIFPSYESAKSLSDMLLKYKYCISTKIIKSSDLSGEMNTTTIEKSNL